jgi:hypothetical protein
MKITVRHNKSEIIAELPLDGNHRRHPIEAYGLVVPKTDGEDHSAPFNRLMSLIKEMTDNVIKMEARKI